MRSRGRAALLCCFLSWSACHAINGLDDYTFGDAPGSGGMGVGGEGEGGTPERFSVSVRVVRLSTALTARLGDEVLSFDGAGSQTFEATLSSGSTYDVTFDNPVGEACVSGNANGSVSDDVAVVITCTPLVMPLFPEAPNWLDYVDAAGMAPCDASTATRPADCIHGGEARAVFVPGAVDCTDVDGRDSEDALAWECDDDTDPVRLVSYALNPGVGLTPRGENTSGLIDFSTQAFVELSVEITTPTGNLTTTPATWWSNPIAIGGPTVTHDQAGTIYLIVTDPGQSLTVDGDRVALIIDPAITFTSGGDEALTAENVDFVWIEGEVDRDVDVISTRMAVVRNITVPGTLDLRFNAALRAHGLVLSSGAPCLLAGGNTGLAVELASFASCVRPADFTMGTGGYLRDARAVEYTNPFRIRNATGFAVDHLVVSNTTGPAALNVLASTGVHMTRVIAASSDGNGVRLECTDCSLRGATTTASMANGMLVVDGDGVWLENLLTANNGIAGINIDSTTVSGRNWVAVSQKSAGTSVNLQVSNSDLTIGGNVRLGAADVACMLNNATGINPDCTSANPSTFSLLELGHAMNMFAAKVLMDDVANQSDTAGLAMYATDLDWARFDRFTRSWGSEGSPFPSLDSQGACSSSNLNCRIWDWALKANNIFATQQNAVPTGADADTVGGQSFLINAFELLGDRIGDDDTLCEMGERCVVMPNIGGYQGHGDKPTYIGVTRGDVPNVQLFVFPMNGG